MSQQKMEIRIFTSDFNTRDCFSFFLAAYLQLLIATIIF